MWADILIGVLEQGGALCSVVAAVASVVAIKKSAENSKVFNKRIDKVEGTMRSNMRNLGTRIDHLKEDNAAILRSKIKERAERCIDKGFATDEERVEIHGLYDRYTGNSFVKDLMGRFDKLPLEKGNK